MSRRLAILFLTLAAIPTTAAEPEKPKLVVLVVFDQLRGDYIARWKPYLGPDGFLRLATEGAWFDNCHYPYATTATGPGHASMLTGCGPDVHGIVGNGWYERTSGASVNCVTSTRWDRVPPLSKDLAADELKPGVKEREAKEKKETIEEEPAKTEGPKKDEPAKAPATPARRTSGTPERLLAPTFGDALKAAHPKARVFGLSFKDRSAILPVGPKADGAYWVDSADGMVITSTFFRDAVHPWVADLNKARVADRWFEKTWDRFRLDLDYASLAGPDQMAGEGRGYRQGMTFPHPTDGGLVRPGRAYYDALSNSPFGNDFLMELVKAAVTAEKLGQDDVPDLLAVSFSSNDLIGHTWGPDSQEVLDVTLRSDRVVADLLRLLDDKVGKGKYLVCLTADHGICPLPEVSAARGLDAGRVFARALVAEAEAHLRAAYDDAGLAIARAKWIESSNGMWFYLNHKLIASRDLNLAEVARTLANFLEKQPGILRAMTRQELALKGDPYDAIGRRMRKAFHADRCGDVGIVPRPYWYESDRLTGTTHGTPHAYDTHVPLLVYGPGVRPGVRKDEVVPATIASIFAKGLGIPPPSRAECPAPAGLFE